MKVDRYVEPVEFDRWKQVAEDMGFLYVASGPLVRSSYKVSVYCPHAQFYLFIPPGGRILHRECITQQGGRETDPTPYSSAYDDRFVTRHMNYVLTLK